VASVIVARVVGEPDTSACGCEWRRLDGWGDVIVKACAAHRVEVNLCNQALLAEARARRALDIELDQIVRRRPLKKRNGAPTRTPRRAREL
jgi:hypothetical protein